VNQQRASMGFDLDFWILSLQEPSDPPFQAQGKKLQITILPHSIYNVIISMKLQAIFGCDDEFLAGVADT